MSNETILHFVFWVPAAQHRPFAIRNAAGGSLDFAGAFIRPQWGGVFIYNPSSSAQHLSADNLDEPMEVFHSQLLALLGVPPLGPPLHDALDLHELQIQAVLRRRILETMTDAVHSLTSLLKLVKEQTNMRVAADVQKQVSLALRELELVRPFPLFLLLPRTNRLSQASQAASVKPLPSLPQVLHHARLAQSWATEAFYNPSLLGLLYFPDEHRYAIYTPLFGPLAVPLIASAFRELKAWRKRRRERAKGKQKVE